jgi:hypothetical protein
MSDTTVALTQKEFHRLETVDWGERAFGSLVTNRQFPRATMLRLVRKGLARSVGLVVVDDDDDAIVGHERFREGFVLTEAGRAALDARRAEVDAAWNALRQAP